MKFDALQVTLSDEQTILPLVDEALQHTTTKGIAFQHPEIVAKMDEVRQDLHLEPFYWKLPEQFEGKKVKITLNSQPNNKIWESGHLEVCVNHHFLFFFSSSSVDGLWG